MANTIFDLYKLYQNQFGTTPYFIKNQPGTTEKIVYQIPESDRNKYSIDYTTKQIALNKKSVLGKDIWHPVTFWESANSNIEIDACTIGVNLVKTVITTAVSERKGAVHETFNIDDYRFNIKGFLIGKNRFFPEDDITMLKNLFETTQPVFLKGGYPELFLEETGQVIITALEFPEVEGKAQWIKPFSLSCISDFVQDLILE
jgi:hypothetical protein